MSNIILCADDSKTIQTVAEITFRASDFEYVGARSADEALDKARAQKPALILADAVMPGKTGYELCQMVKADPQLADVPVLMLCGNSAAYDASKGSDAGADGHLSKPWDTQALLDKVAELVAKHGGADAGAPSAVLGIDKIKKPRLGTPPPIAPSPPTMPRTPAVGKPKDVGASRTHTIMGMPTIVPPMPAPGAPGTPPTPVKPAIPTPAAVMPPTIRPPTIGGASPNMPPRPAIPQSPGAPRRPSTVPSKYAPPAMKSAITKPGVPEPPKPATSPGEGDVRPTAAVPAQLGPSPQTARPPRLGTPSPVGMPSVDITPVLTPPVVTAKPAMPEPVAPARPTVTPARPTARAAAPARPAATPVAAQPAGPRPTAAQPLGRPPMIRGIPGKRPVFVAPAALRQINVAQVTSAAVARAAAEAGIAADGPEVKALLALSQDVVERMLWEIVPDLAEAIIRENLATLTAKHS